MNEESKFVNFRKRKPASDEEKSRDRAMHRVVNLPEHRVVEERARHRVENLPEPRVVEERARHRVENLPEHRLVEVRDADRANSESKTKMHIFFKTRQNQSHLIGIHNVLTLPLSLLF